MGGKGGEGEDGKGEDGKGRDRKGGEERTGREGTGREGRERTGREGRERTGREGTGREGRERTGREGRERTESFSAPGHSHQFSLCNIYFSHYKTGWNYMYYKTTIGLLTCSWPGYLHVFEVGVNVDQRFIAPDCKHITVWLATTYFIIETNSSVTCSTNIHAYAPVRITCKWPCTNCIASLPVLPTPAFISQPWRKSEVFLHGCETKAGVGRTGNEATDCMYYPVCLDNADSYNLDL